MPQPEIQTLKDHEIVLLLDTKSATVTIVNGTPHEAYITSLVYTPGEQTIRYMDLTLSFVDESKRAERRRSLRILQKWQGAQLKDGGTERSREFARVLRFVADEIAPGEGARALDKVPTEEEETDGDEG